MVVRFESFSPVLMLALALCYCYSLFICTLLTASPMANPAVDNAVGSLLINKAGVPALLAAPVAFFDADSTHDLPEHPSSGLVCSFDPRG